MTIKGILKRLRAKSAKEYLKFFKNISISSGTRCIINVKIRFFENKLAAKYRTFIFNEEEINSSLYAELA